MSLFLGWMWPFFFQIQNREEEMEKRVDACSYWIVSAGMHSCMYIHMFILIWAGQSHNTDEGFQCHQADINSNLDFNHLHIVLTQCRKQIQKCLKKATSANLTNPLFHCNSLLSSAMRLPSDRSSALKGCQAPRQAAPVPGSPPATDFHSDVPVSKGCLLPVRRLPISVVLAWRRDDDPNWE